MNFLAKGFFGRKDRKEEEKFGQFFENAPHQDEEEKLKHFYPPEPGEEDHTMRDLQLTDLEDTEEEPPLGYWETKPSGPKKTAEIDFEKEFGIPAVGEKPRQLPVFRVEEKHDLSKPSVSRAYQKSDASAPLFVKVDRYNEIITKLQETKDLLRGVKTVFPVLLEIDQVKKDATESLRVALQKIEKNMAELDSDLARPGQARLEAPSEMPTHIENSLSDLQSQLSSLRGQLERARK